MNIRKVIAAVAGVVGMLVVIVSAVFMAPAAEAHHSYAMYDGNVYKVLTGVIVRIVPNAAHFEMHMVRLNEERNALARREDGEPQVWVLQMESAAQARREGVTVESFPRGTIFSMGIHPRRDGKPAGDRGGSGLFRCPKDSPPAAGLHCDSVEGTTAFGGEPLPEEGAASRETVS